MAGNVADNNKLISEDFDKVKKECEDCSAFSECIIKMELSQTNIVYDNVSVKDEVTPVDDIKIEFNNEQPSMAGNAVGYHTNNTLNPEDIDNIKKEIQDPDYIDDKASTCKTTININSREFNANSVKRELSKVHNNIVYGNVKVKNEIGGDEDTNDEFNTKQLVCDNCHEDYLDYCNKCDMLVHILNSNSFTKTKKRIPKHTLIIRKGFNCSDGVFALKTIPADVIFGPFTGYSASEHTWKVKGGTLMIPGGKSTSSNWMSYVDSAKSISEQNLVAFQYKGHLYYRSNRTIWKGEELLVYFGEKYKANLNIDVIDFVPATENDFKSVFACTICCLGFSSERYLFQHKTICPRSSGENILADVLTQCVFCEIYLDEKEYLKYHINHCSKKNYARPSQTSGCPSSSKKRKKVRSRMYKCALCRYTTKYKADIRRHNSNHYNAKLYRRGRCHLKLKRQTCLNMEIQSKDKHFENVDYECAKCDFRTNHENILKVHVDELHNAANYKCTQPALETNNNSDSKQHVDVKRPQEGTYKCSECDYTANYKSSLAVHVQIKHSEETAYKCLDCDFKTKYEHHLKVHINAKHLNAAVYKCLECDFKTNYKINLKVHVVAKHPKKTIHKCTACDFLTHYHGNLKVHMVTKHLGSALFKCLECGFNTNYKRTLNAHMVTKHRNKLTAIQSWE